LFILITSIQITMRYAMLKKISKYFSISLHAPPYIHCINNKYASCLLLIQYAKHN
jgi:hypothetical protein